MINEFCDKKREGYEISVGFYTERSQEGDNLLLDVYLNNKHNNGKVVYFRGGNKTEEVDSLSPNIEDTTLCIPYPYIKDFIQALKNAMTIQGWGDQIDNKELNAIKNHLEDMRTIALKP